MLDESYIDLILAVYSIITVGIYFLMYKNRAYPLLWIAASISLGIGSLIFYFRHYNSDFRIIGNIFYFFTSLFIGISIILLYVQKYTTDLNNNSKYRLITILIVILILTSIITVIFQFSLINIIQITMMTFLLLVSFIMVKIYSMKKSITQILMLFTVYYSFFTLLFSIIHNFGFELAWELAYLMKAMLYSTLILTALSAPIENRMKKTEDNFRTSFSRAEFYKDLFIHDINNMLQVILSAIQIHSIDHSKKAAEENEDYMEVIKTQVYRGSKLIENLRKLSHLEKKEILFKKIELISMLKKVIDQIKSREKGKKINFELKSESNAFYLDGNELIQEVFENLIANSIQHNENTEVEIIINIQKEERNNQKYIRIVIIDNGKGIEDDRKKSVFDRAFKMDNDMKGLGLGLSLVNKILMIFDGKIWVEDRVEGDYTKGSKFIILIPETEK